MIGEWSSSKGEFGLVHRLLKEGVEAESRTRTKKYYGQADGSVPTGNNSNRTLRKVNKYHGQVSSAEASHYQRRNGLMVSRLSFLKKDINT